MERRRLRILFVSFSSKITGPTKSLLLLLKYMPKDQFESMVLMPQGGEFSELLFKENIKFYTFPNFKFFSIPKIMKLLLDIKPDLVYGNNFSGAVINTLLSAQLLKIPTVIHFREVVKQINFKEKLVLNKTKTIVAVSKASADSVRKHVKDVDKVHVVYNGVELPKLNDDECKFKEYKDKSILLNVSHVTRHKGQIDAVEIAKNLISMGYKNFVILIAGSLDRDKGYVEEVQNRIKNEKLCEYLKIIGFCNDINCLYRKSCLYIHFSYKDAHPRSVIEAMAHGLPVVAYAADGVAETIVDGVTGYLIDKGDTNQFAIKVADLLKYERKRKQFMENALAVVKDKFTADNTAKQIVQILDIVMNKLQKNIF